MGWNAPAARPTFRSSPALLTWPAANRTRAGGLDVSQLFTPFQQRSLTFRNRIAASGESAIIALYNRAKPVTYQSRTPARDGQGEKQEGGADGDPRDLFGFHPTSLSRRWGRKPLSPAADLTGRR